MRIFIPFHATSNKATADPLFTDDTKVLWCNHHSFYSFAHYSRAADKFCIFWKSFQLISVFATEIKPPIFSTFSFSLNGHKFDRNTGTSTNCKLNFSHSKWSTTNVAQMWYHCLTPHTIELIKTATQCRIGYTANHKLSYRMVFGMWNLTMDTNESRLQCDCLNDQMNHTMCGIQFLLFAS